jgi:predicted lysophospholipase L1 biosynthesis ABC-type transport system permease subunit
LVGIGVSQDDAFPISTWDKNQAYLLLSHALYDVFPKFTAFDGGVYRLRPGTDVATFQADVARIKQRHPETGEGEPFVSDETGRQKIVSKAVRPLVGALIAFGAALALTLLLLLAQTIARQIAADATDNATLRALGASPRRLAVVSAVPAVLAAAAGAAVAVAIAIVASPLMPIGAARLPEPNPGVSFDALVLGAGAATLVLILSIAALIPAIRAAGRSAVGGMDELSSRSRAAERIARSGLPVPASTGVRMALVGGRGATAVPVRLVRGGAFISIVALAAAYTFGASCNRAVSTPKIYGQRWDAIIDAQFTAFNPNHLHLLGDPSYASVTGGIYPPGLLSVDGVAVPVLTFNQLKGFAFPTMLEGRPPNTRDEIVLGTTILRSIHKRVGDRVRVSIADLNASMTVVGRATFPAFGLGVFTPTGLGEGAIMSPAALPPILEPGTFSFVLVRFAKGATAEAIRRVDTACTLPELAVNLCANARTQRPPEIESYARVKNLPWVLTGVLAILAVATLGHGLVSTVRRRRRDLAVLKTFGFVRRQVSSTVAWQATTIILLALAGLPFGVAAGRWAWTSLADSLGIAPEPRVPILAVAITIPAALLVANLVAFLPGLAASRTPAALVLRAE